MPGPGVEWSCMKLWESTSSTSRPAKVTSLPLHCPQKASIQAPAKMAEWKPRSHMSRRSIDINPRDIMEKLSRNQSVCHLIGGQFLLSLRVGQQSHFFRLSYHLMTIKTFLPLIQLIRSHPGIFWCFLKYDLLVLDSTS